MKHFRIRIIRHDIQDVSHNIRHSSEDTKPEKHN
jgi:hypothetical protein